jgi:hypothetical protein
MRSTDFPFAVTPQRLQRGGSPSFADRARTVAKGATFAFNDEIEAGLRALAQLDPAAYRREVARIRAQQKAYEEANPYESAGLEIGGALLPALLPGAQGLAGARMASLAAKAPRAARIAPVVGEAALYGVGAADSMADIPRSVASEGAQALGMYGVGAAAAPRLKALGAKVAARLRPNKPTAPPSLAVKPQETPAPPSEAPLAVKPQGITAYHGSPYSFDRFDMSKIGTGEGAQAFGHGLYFAENEDVAQGYRDALTKGAMNSIEFKKIGLSPNDRAHAMTFARTTNNLFPEVAARDFANYSGKELTPDLIEAFRKTMDIPKGSMYQVRIDADPADFLDWDAPLSGQSEKVRGALAAMDPDTYHPSGNDFDPMEQGQITYQRLANQKRDYGIDSGKNALTTLGGSQAGATGDLSGFGIPGIKYLDQGSRGAGDGTRNYVVFDDKLISILKKYGWAPGMAIPAAAMEEYEAERELARGGLAAKYGV